MNRHHPYGGYDGGPRRGGPQGPGPDRSHRSERGGPSNRGRGSYGRGGRSNFGNFEGNMNIYDSSNPSGNAGGYGSYDMGMQDPYYQSYGGGTSQYPQPSQSYDSTSQGFGGYEESPNSFDDNANGFRKRQPKRERDDKVHDSIIEERISRERPCRTLFIRNIKYETNSDDVRRMFEEHGDIKTFFDLIANRGMVFVTYHDLRAAERARDRLQGSEISGRPIDVHYSLPRDDQASKNPGKGDSNQQLQGFVQVTLRGSPSGQPIDDTELRRRLSPCGDIKSIMPANDRVDSRYVEFYDTRAAEEAADRLLHQSLQDGVMDVVLAWNNADNDSGKRELEEGGRGRGGGGGRGGRGNRGRGRGGGGGRNYDDEYDRRDFRDRGPPPRGGPGRYDDEYGRGGGYGDRYSNSPRGGYGPPSGYNEPLPPPRPAYNDGPPPPRGGPVYGGPPPGPPPGPPGPPPAPDDRLEQARKVQQLLSMLKQPAGGSGPPPGPVPPGGPPMGPPNGNGYYGGGPQPPYAGAPPPTNGYGPPSSNAPPALGQPPASLASLPPNIAALIQQAQAQSQQAPPPGGPPGYGGMPPHGGPPAMGNQNYMSYLPPKPA